MLRLPPPPHAGLVPFIITEGGREEGEKREKEKHCVRERATIEKHYSGYLRKYKTP